ncbi:MAG: ATP phosphoribosyltransferase regulatory subunit, partial [Nonlabens sp.]
GVFTDLKIKGYTIKINNRKILAGLAEVIGAPEQLIPFTVALDKLDKIGEERVKAEMLNSGISQEAIDKLSPVFTMTGSYQDKIQQMKTLLRDSNIGQEGIQELEYVQEAIAVVDLKTAILDLDITLARGLNYYTGCIFEVSAPDGVNLGSIAAGGRYDDLTGIFGLKDTSGVGISFGLDRIYLLLEELNLFPQEVRAGVDLLIVNFGKKESLHALTILSRLRQSGISAELYPDAAKMKKQLNYAHRNEIPYVILLGENEIAASKMILKNMATGTQTESTIDEITKNILG